MLDLHMHLDGSIPIHVLKELMYLNFSSLNDDMKRMIDDEESLKNKVQVASNCDSLIKYLECFDLPLTLLQNEASVKLAVKGLLYQLKDEGMRYVEIRFAPQLHSQNIIGSQNKLEHEAKIVKAALDASKEVEGIRCNFILCLMRGSKMLDNTRTLYLAKDFRDQGIVAIDLAGSEADYPTHTYRRLFDLAHDMGLDYTIHAGEAGGIAHRIKSIRDAISYGAKRIGHGIAICGDPELKEICKERGIAIECCPTSNVQTKAIGCIEFHPIYVLLEDGLKVSVNTDNRTVSGTTIAKEFDILDFSKNEKNLLIKNAIDMAFLSDDEKKEIFPEWVK